MFSEAVAPLGVALGERDLRGLGGESLGLGDNLIDVADHVESDLRQVVVLAVKDLLNNVQNWLFDCFNIYGGGRQVLLLNISIQEKQRMICFAIP